MILNWASKYYLCCEVDVVVVGFDFSIFVGLTGSLFKVGILASSTLLTGGSFFSSRLIGSFVGLAAICSDFILSLDSTLNDFFFCNSNLAILRLIFGATSFTSLITAISDLSVSVWNSSSSSTSSKLLLMVVLLVVVKLVNLVLLPLSDREDGEMWAMEDDVKAGPNRIPSSEPDSKSNLSSKVRAVTSDRQLKID